MAKFLTKIMSIMVLAVFILSILPVALAKNDQVRMNKEIKLPPALEKAPIGHVKEQVRNGVMKVQNNVGKAQERIERVQERYEVARERYTDAKENYLDQKEKLVQLRQRAQDCQEDFGECVREQFNLKKGAVQHLLKTIEVMERSLEKLTDRVESSKVLTEEEKEEALAEIAELEVELTTNKEALEQLLESEDVSAEELREGIKELKKTWQEVRKEQRKIVARLTHSKLEKLVEKHHGLERSMQARIDSLVKAGVDVSELEKIRDRFVAHDDEVQEKFAIAKKEWQEAENKQDAWEAWREAQLEVREGMKESREILREFTQKFVELKHSLSDELEEELEDEETEEEDEVDEEDEEADENDEEETEEE